MVLGLNSVRKNVTSGAGEPAWLPLPTVVPSTMASHGTYVCGHSPGDGTGVGTYVGEGVGNEVGWYVGTEVGCGVGTGVG